MRTIRSMASLVAVLFSSLTIAQNTGTLKGNVTDETGQPMPGATIRIMDDSTMVTGSVTDEKGDYTVRHIAPGIYNILFSYVGLKTRTVKKVEFQPDETIFLNKKMVPDNTLTQITVSEEYVKPILNATYSTVTRLTHDQIENMAVSKGDIVSMITAVTPGVIASEDGKNLYVRGSRSGSTAFYVDGNRVIGSPSVPALGIAGMEVLTGGVPAQYGDCTGGLVIITTKEYKWEMHKKEVKRQKRDESMAKDIEEIEEE